MHIRQVEIDNTPFCRIEVTDNGVGIPEELQEHIFDSFITGPNTPQFSSKTGIGLHIVKHTMELHHGTVTFQSKPGEGSTFTLLIPEGKAHFQADKSIYLPEETPVRTSYPEIRGRNTHPEKFRLPNLPPNKACSSSKTIQTCALSSPASSKRISKYSKHATEKKVYSWPKNTCRLSSSAT